MHPETPPASSDEAPSRAENQSGGGFRLLEDAERSEGRGVLSRSLRSRARHLAVLTLYRCEAHRFSPDRPVSEMLRWLCKDAPRRARARALVEAALAERPEIDRLLDAAVTNWSLERLGATERAALRVAAGEMLVLRDAPPGPVINDAVELARRYGEEASPGFVNAVLTQLTELPEVAERLKTPSSEERAVDLHTHTAFSDGDLSPRELVEAAKAAGLVAIAVADHDEIRGIAPAAAAGGELGVEVIPGVELTSYLGEAELHLLGLFVDPQNPELISELDRFREVRRTRVEKMCRKLAGLGAAVEPERVYALAGEGAVGRPHVAKAIVEAGHATSIKEAFHRYIADGRPACMPKEKITPTEAVSLVHAAGGLAFLAHPGVGGKDELLPALVEAGIDGLETRHVLHSEPTAQHYRRWAGRRDLLCTGGSDFHGESFKGRPLGEPFVPETWLIELRNHWKLARAEATPAGTAPDEAGE